MIIRNCKKRKFGSAFAIMGSKDSVLAATNKRVCGDLSNPWRVLPLGPNVAGISPFLTARYRCQALEEDSVLTKLRNIAQTQSCGSGSS